ncbi:MAG: hypothetical protein ACYC0Y_18825 [Pirellulales bacterium]
MQLVKTRPPFRFAHRTHPAAWCLLLLGALAGTLPAAELVVDASRPAGEIRPCTAATTGR